MAYRWKSQAAETQFKFTDAALVNIGEQHTASEVLETAAVNPGNVHLPTTAEVEQGVFYGPASALEGEFAGGDPNITLHSAGGNWVDENLNNGVIEKDIVWGIGGIGTLEIHPILPTRTTPRFGITTFDSTTFTDQNIIPLKKPLPMDLNGYSAYLTLEQLESDDSFQLLQLSLEGQAFSGRFV